MTLSRFVSVAVVSAILLGGSACSKIVYAPAYQTGSVTHVVICYLKDKNNAAGARKQVMDAARDLRRIPGVYDIEVGGVLASGAPMTVSDYDIGVVVSFRDAAAMQAYLLNPIHQRVVKEVLEPLTSKVLVYDFTNQEYQ